MEQNKNLLKQIETISYEATKCKMNFSGIKSEEAVRSISEFLSISREQVVIFSCLLEISLQRTITLENLARHLGCSVLKVISLVGEIDLLVKKSLVKKKKLRMGRNTFSYSSLGFVVPHNVIESLRTSDKKLLTPPTHLKFPALLKQVREAVKEREQETISSRQLFYEIEEVIANNQGHEFIRYLNRNIHKTEHKCIALVLAYHYLTGQTITELDYLTDAVYDDVCDQLEFRKSILSGNNELVKKNVIMVKDGDFSDLHILSFSRVASKIIFKQYPELITEEKSVEGLINHKTITPKKLYFNDSIKSEIEDFVQILGKAEFKKFLGIARRNKVNEGITAIFYGHPGTGKTELVHQIARKTQRNLFMVDLSELRSKWFGESEKRIKKVFDDYRDLHQISREVPILFINEADGMFSKRRNIHSGSGDTLQTQNTIQNIILQELENFKGILIATTNLTGNLDKAFERRLLFRIDFPKPDAQVRQMIWKNKLPQLPMEKARLLAEKFDLTGGQIDNQVKQLLLKRVLKNRLKVYETLLGTCAKDQDFTQRRKIGF